MDLTKFNDMADSKRMKQEVEKLKDVISRQKERIIKTTVGQATISWELQEKLLCTQRDHETLQRNMVQVQMAHETVSAQYQEELRLRPETLNKLVSTREICDVLEENVGRLRASLQRSAADRAALAEAYALAGAAVATVHTETEKRLLAATNQTRSAQDLARLSSEHGDQLKECVSRERVRADQAVADAERLREQRDSVAEHLARRDTLLQERDKTIQELRNELRRLMDEYNERNERSTSTIAELEREAGAAATLRVALMQADARVEVASRDFSRLVTELTATTAAKDDAIQRIATLNLQIQKDQSDFNKMKEGIALLVQQSEDLSKKVKDKDEKICTLEKVVANSQQKVHTLTDHIAICDKERQRERRCYEEREAERDRERLEFDRRIATTERKLTERADTIEKLMRDIAVIEEAKSRAETTIAEQKNQLERERDDNEKRIAATKTELAESITRLKHEITIETEARLRVETALAELIAKRERENRDQDERVENMKRELCERDRDLVNLRHDLAVEKETRERTDAAMAEQAAEHERERVDFDKRFSDAERELAERNSTTAQLKRDLADESEARARSDATLTALRSELNTAREEAARALDDVRHLKADVRRKDDEAAKQMQIILSIRGEKEQMQDKIDEMQNTINNIQEIARKAPPAGATAVVVNREPPEHDDNAVAAPPTLFRALPQPPRGSQRMMTPTPHRKIRKSHPKPIDTTFNLFSDTSDSMDQGDSLHLDQLSRRFEALSRGDKLSPPPVPVNTRKRSHPCVTRKRVPSASAQPVPEPMAAPPSVRPPQTPQAAEGTRKFFKTRRLERDDRLKK